MINNKDHETYWIKQLLADIVESIDEYKGEYIILDDFTTPPGEYDNSNLITVDSQATYGKYVIGVSPDSDYIWKYCVFKIKIKNNRDDTGDLLNQSLWNYLTLAFQDATAPSHHFNHIFLTSTPNKGDLDVNKRYVRELRVGAWFNKKREGET